MDVPGRQIYPPYYLYSFAAEEQVAPDPFIHWFAARQGIDLVQAKNNYDQFLSQWNQALYAGGAVQWNGVGTWMLTEQKSIQFTAEKRDEHLGVPVRAEKVVRENAGHTVRVGEEHRSSEEMAEFLSRKKSTVSYEIWLSLALLILAVLFWVWQLWGRPLVPSGFANPRKALATHSIQNSFLH